MKNKVYRSPLFYVGDKYKLIEEIKTYFPKKINKFVEPFVGGGSVFMNIDAKEFLLNDVDKQVYELHNFLISQSENQKDFFENVEMIIDRYNLSKSFREDKIPQELKDKWKKTYYAKYNKEGFNKLKSDYNENQSNLYLYVLLIYGFNRMLRFNSKGEYNLPVGNVDFNKNVIKALEDYAKLVSSKEIKLHNDDYTDFLHSIEFNNTDFIYADPPYLITFSEYNKLWNEQKENELLTTLDDLDSKGIRFAVSNVTHYKGKVNEAFLNWSSKYNVHSIKSNYISYHDNKIKEFKEVLVTNYAKKTHNQKKKANL